MTFIIKVRGDLTRPLLAEYTCPEHGVFSCTVVREENGDAPDVVACPVPTPREGDCCEAHCDECGERSTWTASAVRVGVKRFEVVRGGWEKPERPTYLDTRELGEGQSEEEFRAKRAKVWEEQRHREIKEML